MYIVPVVYHILMCCDSSTEENKDRTSSLLTTMDEPSPFAVAEFVGSVLFFCYFFLLLLCGTLFSGKKKESGKQAKVKLSQLVKKKIL